MEMLSMTGFGVGEASVAGMTITVELRAVNHRFLDIAMKLPPALISWEIDIRNFLKSRLARGRVSCFVQVRREAGDVSVVLDENRLAQAISLLQKAADSLGRETGEKPKVKLRDLMAVPNLFGGEEIVSDDETLRGALFEAVEGATKSLLEMKTAEGRETAEDMRTRLATLRTLLTKVVAIAPEAVAEGMQRMQERIAELLGEVQLDPQRLAQETAILADKSNINEECERLECHLGQYASTLDEGGQVAKRLNFLLQEMHREVNTMGSKSNSMEITQIVISMKDEVESMREQILNLE